MIRDYTSQYIGQYQNPLKGTQKNRAAAKGRHQVLSLLKLLFYLRQTVVMTTDRNGFGVFFP